MAAPDPAAAAGPDLPQRPFQPLLDARRLAHEGIDLVVAWLQLAELETRNSGASLAAMMGQGILLVVLIMTTWLGLMAALVLALIRYGTHPVVAVLAGSAVNLLLIWPVYRAFRVHEGRIGWAATLRSLQGLSRGLGDGATQASDPVCGTPAGNGAHHPDGQ